MNSKEPVEIPDDYLCPITREIMTNPVVAADGHTYEKSAILQWIQTGHSKSPLTGTPLNYYTLTDNITLRKVIQDFQSKNVYYKGPEKIDLSMAIEICEEMWKEYLQKQDGQVPEDMKRLEKELAVERQGTIRLKKENEYLTSEISKMQKKMVDQTRLIEEQAKRIEELLLTAPAHERNKVPSKTSFDASPEKPKHDEKSIGNAHTKMTLKGHTGSVISLQLTPSGDLVSGSYDKTIRVWDVSTGTCTRSLEGHTKWVSCFQLLPTGELVSGSHDNHIKVWNLESGKCIKTLNGHTRAVACLQLMPTGELASGSGDKTIKLWDLDSGNCISSLQGHNEWVLCLKLLPNGDLVSGSGDETIKVWDVKTNSCVRTLRGHNNSVACLELLPNGELISGSGDQTIKFWNLNTGDCLRTLTGHTDWVMCLELLPTGELVSGSGSSDSTIKVWNLKSGTCIRTLEGQKSGITSLQRLLTGEIVSGAGDSTIRVWEWK